ncbi:hypothetical protein Glove_262g43 [Diversispora epigaea]|uniref:MHD domain-containing protein n=1 Tax=Diversispora epigaea TaxID=1348612 RepID=A0A397ICN2_9GLOM|nr:hypothetical protein Glove_262g43 [Diversispora epigaea]
MELSRSPSFDDSNNITQQEISKNQTEMPFIQAFLNDRPKLSFDTVQLRLRNAKTLNHEIAEYFKERAIIEDNYIKSIQRLANKTFVADRAYMGTFTSIWDTLFDELIETATLHSFYVTKISDEIETPLREMTIADQKWTQLKQEETNLSKLAKEYEERVSKVNRFKTKKEKLSGKRAETSENKLIEAQKALEQIKAEWNSEWPKYLERSQEVDFMRWVHLKEILTNFETMQVESYQKRIEISEKNLSTIMEFNVQNEISDFCSKAIEGNLSHVELNNSGSSLRNALVTIGTIGTMRRKRTPSHNSDNLYPSKSENDGARNGVNILRNSSSRTSFTLSNENSFSSPVEISSSPVEMSSSPGEISSSPVEISSSPGEISSSPVEISSSSLPSEISVPKVLIDSEGYSIPPPENNINNKSWDGISSNGDETDSDAFSVNSSCIVPEKTLRVEIKPTSTEVNEADAAAAMSHVILTLKSTPVFKNRPPRGRRDRSTYYSDKSDNNLSVDQHSPLNLPSPSRRSSSFALSSPNTFEFPEIINNNNSNDNHSKAISIVGSSPPSSSSGGLRASIIETINVMTKIGNVTKLLITGEINISYSDVNNSSIRGGEGEEGSSPPPLRIKINNFEALEKFVPNASYIRAIVVPEDDDNSNDNNNNNNGLFEIDTGLLSLTGGKSVAVIKYQVHVDPENKSSYLPLQIIPQWKCESNKTSLVIAYQVNPECKLITTAETATDRKSSKLSDISFIIPVDGDVEYVQSKPTGVWSTEKNWMYWKLEDIDLTSTTTSTTTTTTTTTVPTATATTIPETPPTPFTPTTPSPLNSTSSSDQKKIIARFGTNKASQPAPAAVKFICKGQLLSNISLEIVKKDNHSESNNNNNNNNNFSQFQDIECKIVSGKFIASP